MGDGRHETETRTGTFWIALSAGIVSDSGAGTNRELNAS